MPSQTASTFVDVFVLRPCTVHGKKYAAGATIKRVALLEANRLVEDRAAEVKCDSDTHGPALGARYYR
jgi:hypothetical protein